MKRALLVALLALLLLGAAGTRVLAAGTVCSDRVTLEERVTPGPAEVPGWLNARQSQLLERGALLELPGRVFPVRFVELGITLDTSQTEQALRAALARAGQCSGFSQLRRRFAALPQPNQVVAPSWRFDAERARTTLASLAAEVRLEPVDARLDLVRHVRIDDQPGRELDLDATLAEIARGARDEGAVFPLRTRAVPPAVTRQALADVDVSLVLSAFETDFSRFDRARVPNIRRAAELLNGSVIGPGEVMSFNRTVGPRVEERGFSKAPVIVADVMETGIGGGVCQVASTLHAAARFGALEVVSRRSHSRPSGYAPLGLDAVVIDGEVDLKFRNPYPTPLIVHAFLPTATSLRVELLGREAPRRVNHGFTVEERESFERLVLVRNEYDATKIKKHQKGTQGYRGYSVVRVEAQDGSVSVRRYESRYYPAPEVFWVGAGVRPDDLPPLPEGVTQVQYGEFGVPRAATAAAE
jgi:vancomycin resistance protein YoaR